MQRSYLYVGGPEVSPVCQLTAFGSTGHIITQVPQLVHFASSITGLSHIWFLTKVLNRLLVQDTGGVRITSNLLSKNCSIFSPTISMFSAWYVPSPACSPGFDVGTFTGSRSIILQAVASSAMGSADNSNTFIFFGLPLRGPLPSIAIMPSITQRRGLTRVFKSISIVAKSYGSGNLTWYWLFSKPGIQPNWFLTAPVNRTRGCVFSFGRLTNPSQSRTPLAITKLFTSNPSG